MSTTALAILELLIGGLALIGARAAWPYRKQPAGLPLVVLFLAGAGYALASGINVLLSDPLWTHLVHHLTYPFGMIVAVTVFYLALEYTDREEFDHPAVLGLFIGIVLIDLAIALTDPVHNLIITERIVTPDGAFERTVANTGPYFWIRIIVAFSIGAVAFAFLLAELPNRRGLYRTQLIAVLLAFTAGILGFLWQTFAAIHPGFDVATVGLLTGGLILLWALFYADFLDAMPIARDVLMESMEDGVIAIDANHRIVDFNNHAATIFRLTDSAIGKQVEHALRESPELLAAFEEDTDERQEIRIQGSEIDRFFSLNISRIERSVKQPDSTMVGRIIVIRDISDEVQQRQELQRKNKRLDQFASLVSHDLRNPLSVALGRVRIAKSDEDLSHLDDIEDALERMEELIGDLLELSRLEQEGDTVEAIELAALATLSWDFVDTPNATLEVASNRTILCSRPNVQRLFENLFRNAIEHGGEQVTVRVGTTDDGFFVEDDGPGIPLEKRDRVLEAGYSASPTGTGYGLTIIREIALDHGWSLAIATSDSGGGRFEFTGVTFVE